MAKSHTPDTIHPPFARYSHAVSVPPGQRLLCASGQLGIDASGHIPDGVGAQAKVCFDNIDAILADAGMTRADVVRISSFVVERTDLPGYMAARDVWMADITPPPASTLILVSGFARPEFRVEIEILAAAP